ncbi:hypothetical protein [Kribbella solani]|uniref:Putative Ntn-hydrolase superfamily protein n=1 Tax=Kribbella solani TaxID=236067 RepID=A0A841DNV4_9ACTN|nr:hypothetical protein [Kribbella solani]MBB5980343.1 putative Ntn-hydrolase superfamily protein [Kribbella solani]
MDHKQPEHLQHLATDGNSGKDGCPSYYATEDGDRFIVQGYKLTSADARGQLVNFPEGEDAVIITKALADLIVAHHTGTTA